MQVAHDSYFSPADFRAKERLLAVWDIVKNHFQKKLTQQIDDCNRQLLRDLNKDSIG